MLSAQLGRLLLLAPELVVEPESTNCRKIRFSILQHLLEEENDRSNLENIKDITLISAIIWGWYQSVGNFLKTTYVALCVGFNILDKYVVVWLLKEDIFRRANQATGHNILSQCQVGCRNIPRVHHPSKFRGLSDSCRRSLAISITTNKM